MYANRQIDGINPKIMDTVTEKRNEGVSGTVTLKSCLVTREKWVVETKNQTSQNTRSGIRDSEELLTGKDGEAELRV